jgi:hypothetical protein
MKVDLSSDSHLIHSLESPARINLPEVNLDLEALNWVKYNPRKPLNRWGASITSLNGGIDGIPDLDSLKEYNALMGTSYSESDFRVFTPQGAPLSKIVSDFDVGRSHVIRLPAGGFFPRHRDSDHSCFRLIYTANNCGPENLVWLQGDRVVRLRNQRWYYLNTLHEHAVFAFNQVEFVVFNIIKTDKSIKSLFSLLLIN